MKVVKCIIIMFLCLSFKADAWYKLDGFPEVGYSVKGYAIEGNLSQYAELSIFPAVKKYGILFYTDGKASTENKARIAISICGNIDTGMTEYSQIVQSENWNNNFLLCHQTIYVSVESNSYTTIYRFPQYDH